MNRWYLLHVRKTLLPSCLPPVAIVFGTRLMSENWFAGIDCARPLECAGTFNEFNWLATTFNLFKSQLNNERTIMNVVFGFYVKRFGFAVATVSEFILFSFRYLEFDKQWIIGKSCSTSYFTCFCCCCWCCLVFAMFNCKQPIDITILIRAKNFIECQMSVCCCCVWIDDIFFFLGNRHISIWTGALLFYWTLRRRRNRIDVISFLFYWRFVQSNNFRHTEFSFRHTAIQLLKWCGNKM